MNQVFEGKLNNSIILDGKSIFKINKRITRFYTKMMFSFSKTKFSNLSTSVFES